MLSALLLWLVVTVASVCLLASLLPLATWPHGAFRTLDFPRTQVFLVSMVAVASIWILSPRSTIAWSVTVMFAAVTLIQLQLILKFSFLWKPTVRRFNGDADQTPTARLVSVNVKQSNRGYRRTVDLIRKHQPDIAIFMETDSAWVNALKELEGEFNESIAHPLGNTYGMVLWTKLPLIHSEIRFLTNFEVPSIDCIVELPGQICFRLVAVHPEPPVPSYDSIGRDAEIAAVAKLVADETLPVIVTGDLNDVAWSHTTRRFLRVSGLLDPREGRGHYNSFHADYFFLRWPLDHLFVSKEFQIVRMQRLEKIGSDHFPMLYDFALVLNAPPQMDNSEDPRPGDIEEVNDLVDTERSRNRRPIGHDWEDN